MTNRPEFLTKPHQNGATIVSEFRALSTSDAEAVDKWLLVNQSYGSLTWQERILFNWINEEDPDFCNM